MKDQLKSSVIISYIQTFLSVVFGFIIAPITIRLLGQSEYGIYSLAGSIIPYLSLLDLGLSNSITKYITECRVKNDKDREHTLNGMFFTIYILIAILVLIIGMIILLNTETIFHNGLTSIEISKVRVMLAISILYMAISFPMKLFNGIIMAYERFLIVKIIALVSTILSPITTILVLFWGKTAIYLTLATAVLGTLSNIIQVIYCFKVLKIKVVFGGFDKKIFKDIAAYSFYIFLASIVDVIYWNTDTVILGMFNGSDEIAVYTVASKLNNYYSTFTMTISGMLLPKVVKMVTENKSDKEITNLFIKVSRIQLEIIGVIIIGFLAIGKQFIYYWAGPEYTNAFYIALLIMCIRIIPICQVLGTSILQAKNKHKVRSIIYSLVAIINIVISVPLSKLYGGIGCAIGTVIGLFINMIFINIYYFKVNLDMKKYWRIISKLSIPIIILGISTIYIVNKIGIKTIVDMIIFVAIFLPIYAIVMWIFALNKYEQSLIISCFDKFKIKRVA